MRREACLKFNRNQVFRQRMCCGLKTEPAQWWRVDVQDGTGAGGAQCRAPLQWHRHTLPCALCLVCLGDLECARFIASRASAILASSSMAARPNATEGGSLYHYSAHRPFTPSTPGAPITLPVLGTKFSIPVLKDFEDELYCQEWISLYFCQKFQGLSTKPSIYFFLNLYGNGGLKG